jgi:hypothetical protein
MSTIVRILNPHQWWPSFIQGPIREMKGVLIPPVDYSGISRDSQDDDCIPLIQPEDI